MKKTITVLSLFAIIINLFSIICGAEESSHGWYAVNKNGKISFPSDAELIKAHGGIYIDENASENKKKYKDGAKSDENGRYL